MKKIDINKEIIIEKSNFIVKNSTFFHKMIEEDKNSLLELRHILLDPAPLTECLDYPDLINKINESKIRNIKDLSYSYSFETCFYIVKSIKTTLLSKETIENQIETLRLVTKYISRQSGNLYYSKQNLISINKDELNEIKNSDKKKIKIKKNIS